MVLDLNLSSKSRISSLIPDQATDYVWVVEAAGRVSLVSIPLRIPHLHYRNPKLSL